MKNGIKHLFLLEQNMEPIDLPKNLLMPRLQQLQFIVIKHKTLEQKP